MVPQAPASPMGNAGARLNRPISRQSSASKSSSADGPSGGAGIAASSSAEVGAAPQFEGTDEQLWLLRHFSLELFRIFVVQAPGEAIMLQPASEESLRLCPTKLAPNEYVTLTGSPHDLSGVMEMVPAFCVRDKQKLPSGKSKGGTQPIFRREMNLRQISMSCADAQREIEENGVHIPALLADLGYSAQDFEDAQRFAAAKDKCFKQHTLVLSRKREGKVLLEGTQFGHDCEPPDMRILVQTGKTVPGYGFVSPHKACTCSACFGSPGGSQRPRRPRVGGLTWVLRRAT